MIAVSVVQRWRSEETTRRLIAAADAVELTTDRFEVVVLTEPGASVDPRLQRRIAHRPNVRFLEPGDPPWTDQLRGAYALFLRADEFPLPKALSVLRAFADEHDLDAVCARAVDDAGDCSAQLTGDEPRLHRIPDGDGLAWLVRTRFVDHAAPAGMRPVPGMHIGAVAGYPATYRTADGGGQRRTAPAVAEWRAGVLRVRAELDSPTPNVVASVQHQTSLESYLVPLDQRPDRTVDIVVDPRRASAGEPLAEGIWLLRLTTEDERGGRIAVELASAPIRHAVLGSTIVSGVGGGMVGLDVGATRTPLIGPLDPAAVTVAETARGNSLQAVVDALYAHEARDTAGWLLLDAMAVPARLTTGGAAPRLSALVSGVPGTVELAARLGTASPGSLGLTLTFGPVGAMAVARTANPAESPADAEAVPPPAARGPVARLRHALPSELEPLVQRAARSAAARRLYRRATGLG